MSKKSGPSPPPAPDPSQLIQQQAQANRVNETNPFGSSTYSQGADGTWGRTTTLNPMLQQQLAGQQSLGANAASGANSLFPGAMSNLSQPFNYSGVPQWQNAVGVGGLQDYMPQQQGGPHNPMLGIQGSVNGGPNAQNSLQKPGAVNPNQFDINSYYSKVLAPMEQDVNKQYDRSQQHNDAQLGAQGIPLGSDAYHESQSIQNEGRNDAMNGARSAAYGQALGASQNAFGQQMASNQNQFGQNLQSGNFYNNALGQDFGRNMAMGQFGNQAQGQQFGQNFAQQGQDFSQGLQARGQDIGLGGMNAGLTNQGHVQGLNDATQQRYQPLQDINQLRGLSSNNIPNFSGIQNLDVTGPYGLAYQGQLNAWNSQMANSGANNAGMFGALGSIGSSLPWGSWFSASVLKDVEGDAPAILDRLITLPFKKWRYKGETRDHIGPMAEDWAQAFGGDGVTISGMDAMYVLLKSVQELAVSVRRMEAAHG